MRVTAASLLTLTNAEWFKPFCLGLTGSGIPCAILLCVRSLRIAFIPGVKHLNPPLMYAKSNELFRGKGQAELLSA